MPQMALVEDQMPQGKRLARQARMDRAPPVDLGRASGRAGQAGERDVRQIGPRFGRQAGAETGLVDLAMEMGQCIVRRDARPERVDPPLRSKAPTPEIRTVGAGA
ncbi:hypothetical protein GCM10020258_28760 [Sphingomonas yabuuchiae]